MKNNVNPPGKANSLQIDKAKLKAAAEIIQLLVKTFSQMKIFSFEHENVKKFSDQLYNKLGEYLSKYWKLEIGIEEFSFTLEETPIYTDEQIMKSLPFFFYKDGMKMLYLYKDLEKEEFLNFLEIIQRDSSLPPEESDIVSSFWERDFTNIRCYAPDEFLESKIGAGMEVAEYEVDKDELITGKIELDEEDRQALARGSGLAQKILHDEEEEQDDNGEQSEESETGVSTSILNESELETVGLIIQKNREISQDQELLDLLVEMLYLENRADKFSSTLLILEECLQDMINKGEFSRTTETVLSIQKLEQSLDAIQAGKKESIQEFLGNLKSEKVLFSLKKIYLEKRIKDIRAYLNFLRLTGPEAIPLLGVIYEEEKSPDFKDKIRDILEEMGTEVFSDLMKTADNSRPELTIAIIKILGSSHEKKATQHLAKFVNFENKDIRIETIKALSQFKTNAANTILAAFFSDQEEDLRIMAAQKLDFLGEHSILQRISEIVQDKTFMKKSLPEKKELLDLLGRTQTPEACQILDSIVKRCHFLSPIKTVDTSLHAVSVLGRMETPEALTVLKKNMRKRHKKIKAACKSAIRSIPDK